MNIAETGTLRNLLVSAALLLTLCAGCAEEPVETFEETYTATENHFPVMLNEQVLRADGHAVVLDQNQLSEIEVGEITENPDETFTSVVSFVAGTEVQYQCEARVTYHVTRARIGGGGEILIHSVEELETLSVVPIE